MKRIVLADGPECSSPDYRPHPDRLRDRNCKTEAYVMGDECLLGCVPLECHGPYGRPRQGASRPAVTPGGPIHRM